MMEKSATGSYLSIRDEYLGNTETTKKTPPAVATNTNKTNDTTHQTTEREKHPNKQTKKKQSQSYRRVRRC